MAKQAQIQTALTAFAHAARVQDAGIVTGDGFLVARIPGANEPRAERFAADTAAALRAGDRACACVGIGPVEHLVLRGREGTTIVARVSGSSAAVVAKTDEADGGDVALAALDIVVRGLSSPSERRFDIPQRRATHPAPSGQSRRNDRSAQPTSHQRAGDAVT